MAGTAPCGTGLPVSYAVYESQNTFGPPPSVTISSSSKLLTVTEVLGGRTSTRIVSHYDTDTAALVSSERNASCCLTYWHSSIMRNPDMTYSVASEVREPSADNKDIQSESRPRIEIPKTYTLITGGYFVLPWVRHRTHGSKIAEIEFDPLRVRYLLVRDNVLTQHPPGVPISDRALSVGAEGETTLLWYDPCTYTVDAYSLSDGKVFVRQASP